MALEVFLTPEQLKKKATEIVEKILADARHYCSSRRCRNCNSKNIKPVAIHEEMNPLFPNSIVIYCKDCGYHAEKFADAAASIDQKYKKDITKAGYVEAPKSKGDEMIAGPK